MNQNDYFSLKIEIGEEIFVSYGNHSNDFLLVECAKQSITCMFLISYIFTNLTFQDGFILEENRWDSLPIDDLVLHHLIYKPARKQLENAGYLGSQHILPFIQIMPDSDIASGIIPSVVKASAIGPKQQSGRKLLESQSGRSSQKVAMGPTWAMKEEQTRTLSLTSWTYTIRKQRMRCVAWKR